MPVTVADRIAAGNDYVARHIYALEAEAVNTLYDAYRRAYDDMIREINAAFAQLGGNTWNTQHLAYRRALLQQIEQRMTALDGESAELISQYLTDGLQAGYYGTGWLLDAAVYDKLGVSLQLPPLLPTEAIRAQVLAPYEGVTFVERFADNRTEFVLRIKRALAQSQIEGDTVFRAQKRLARELGIEIGRRTKAERASNRAAFARTEMIARTELLRAANNGALAVYERNQDVLKGWEWKTALDERVCPQCAPLDGKQFVFGSRQMTPPIHPRCRCTSLPVLINKRLQDEIAGPRVTFPEWAARKGLTRNEYGQAFNLRGKDAPRKAA
jgi:SPP1 gp7 family putative phage head morphogenesis protein